MTGPEGPRERPGRERSEDESPRERARPPGDFLSEELASDTQRFLDEVKRRISESKEGGRRTPPRERKER